MNAIKYNDLVSAASGSFLGENIPVDLLKSMDTDLINEFIMLNSWEPLENRSADDTWWIICACADEFKRLLQDNNIEVVGD